MNEKKLGDFADMLGTIIAVACIVWSMDFIESDGYWLLAYTFGVFVLTTKINRIIRAKE